MPRFVTNLGLSTSCFCTNRKFSSCTVSRLFCLIMLRSSIIILSTVSVLVTSAVLLYFCNPTTSTFFPKCPFYTMTGLKCPGCGTLRSIHSALNGRIDEAIAFNPILVVAVPLLVTLIFVPKIAKNKYVGYGIIGIVALYWIMRNII